MLGGTDAMKKVQQRFSMAERGGCTFSPSGYRSAVGTIGLGSVGAMATPARSLLPATAVGEGAKLAAADPCALLVCVSTGCACPVHLGVGDGERLAANTRHRIKTPFKHTHMSRAYGTYIPKHVRRAVQLFNNGVCVNRIHYWWRDDSTGVLRRRSTAIIVVAYTRIAAHDAVGPSYASPTCPMVLRRTSQTPLGNTGVVH